MITLPEPLLLTMRGTFDTTQSADGKIKVWYSQTDSNSEFITTTSFDLRLYKSFLTAIRKLTYVSIIDIKYVEDFSSMRIKLKEKLAKGEFYKDLADLIATHVDV